MTKLEQVINTVLKQQQKLLSASTYESRRYYCNQLLKLAPQMDIEFPCQELYDTFTARAGKSVNLWFQLNHCVKLIDSAAGTRAVRLDGILYNEPSLPTEEEVGIRLRESSYPISAIDVGSLIIKAWQEIRYLHLTESTSGQYLHAWRDLYRYFYIQGFTEYSRSAIQSYIDEITIKRDRNQMQQWKWKINRRSALALIEVAETGHFKWKPIFHRTCRCFDESLEEIRLQYLMHLGSRNLSKSTIALHDYVFRTALEPSGFRSAKELQICSPAQVLVIMHGFSSKCCQRSIATIFPIIRLILNYLFTAGAIGLNLSGVVMGAFVQRGNISSYIAPSDEDKLLVQLEQSSRRTKAIVLLALRLGLRESDICQLTFDEIDWHKDRIRLIQKKTGESIVLPLLPDVGNALMDYILSERPKRTDSYPYIFLRKQAPYSRLTSAYMSCSKVIKQAGIKPVDGKTTGIHLYRYTLVHRLLAAKVPHQVITDALGHVSKESDKPYLSMEESMLRLCALDLSVIGVKTWKGGSKGV